MSSNPCTSQYYLSIYEAFCNIPVPDDPFSLLIPTEDEEQCEAASLDILDGLDDLTELGDYVLDLIDAVNNEPTSRTPVSNPEVDKGYHSFSEDPSWETEYFPPCTADNKQPLRISLGVEERKLPEWLVRAEVFDNTTHHLCTVEVQDLNAKRLKLLCMHVAEKVPGFANAPKTSKQDEDSASKSLKENTIPKVLRVVQPNQPTAMKNSSEQQPSNASKAGGVKLVSEKLWDHFHKLSKINVPVLGSSMQGSSNAPLKSRRKQTLLPQVNAFVPAKVKLEAVATEAVPEEPGPVVSSKSTIQLTDDGEELAEQSSVLSVGDIREEASDVFKNQQNFRSGTKKLLQKLKSDHKVYGKVPLDQKMLHKLKGNQKNCGKVSLDQKSRKLSKSYGRPGFSTHRHDYS